jgi:hypothetical protein
MTKAYQTKEQHKAQKKEYYINNKEKRLTQMKKWYNTRVKCNICGKEMNQGSLKRHKERKH